MSDFGDDMRLIRQMDSDRSDRKFDAVEDILKTNAVVYEYCNIGNTLLIKHRTSPAWYYYFVSSNKWRRRGDTRVYRSKDICSFLTKYLEYTIVYDGDTSLLDYRRYKKR